MTDESAPRPGSTQDLVRRMDRIEGRQDGTDAKVDTLAATVARVEMNQTHQAELNKLRFDALDTGVGTVRDALERFMGRIEGIITGEVRLPQNERLMKDYQDREAKRDVWEAKVDERLDGHDKYETQGRLLGRIGVLLVTSNIIAIIAAVAAMMKTP